MKCKIIGTVLGAVLLALGATTNAQAATVLEGTGYDLDGGIHYLDKRPWIIEYYDSYSRTRLHFYMGVTGYDLTKATGVKFQNSTIINHKSDHCPGITPAGQHRLIVRLTATVDRSASYMCNVNGMAHSSYVRFARYRWDHQTRNGSHKVYRRNVSSHELGHSAGLGHAKPEYLPGADPLMSGNHWGGYGTHYEADNYTPYDLAGLHRLVANRP